MRMVQKEKWKDIQSKVKNMEGKRPKSEHCVKNAVQRVHASGKKGVAMSTNKNCGRKKALTPQGEKMVVQRLGQVEERFGNQGIRGFEE